jgi:hypothetical protein
MPLGGSKMGYKKATTVLPQHLLRAVQDFIDGEYLYIPRKQENRKRWGENSSNRQRIVSRNREIAARRKAGWSVHELAEAYFLSDKAVYKILSSGQS